MASTGLSGARKRKKTRLYLVAGGVAMLCAAAALMLFAFRDNVVFFFGPSEVEAGKVAEGKCDPDAPAAEDAAPIDAESIAVANVVVKAEEPYGGKGGGAKRSDHCEIGQPDEDLGQIECADRKSRTDERKSRDD